MFVRAWILLCVLLQVSAEADEESDSVDTGSRIALSPQYFSHTTSMSARNSCTHDYLENKIEKVITDRRFSENLVFASNDLDFARASIPAKWRAVRLSPCHRTCCRVMYGARDRVLTSMPFFSILSCTAILSSPPSSNFFFGNLEWLVQIKRHHLCT